MDPAVEYACWYICSLLSLSVAAVFFCISQFVKLQFANSKLPFSIFIVILLICFCSFVNKVDFIRTKMDLISNHRFCWLLKGIVEFSILVFVTMLTVLMNYPRFRAPDKQENRSISSIRAYCQNPNFFDLPQVKDICSYLPEEQNSKQGDEMGFASVATFSFHIFSTSMLLRLHEEYGLFYMCLELTMNAAVEIPGIGGSILNWYYVGPTAFYCFLLIIVRCYIHSSGEVRTRGGNSDGHHDVNDAVRPTGVSVELQTTTGIGVELHEEENQLGGGHDVAEGGGGGGRKTGNQGHTTDLGSAGSGWKNESAEDTEGKLIDQILLSFLIICLYDLFLREMMFSFEDNKRLRINGVRIALTMVTGALLLTKKWITCKRISNRCFCWCLTVFEFGLGFVTRIFRQLGLELNQGDSHDGAHGGGGGRKTGDQGHSTGSVRETVSAEEGDGHKAERTEGTSSDDEIERISSTRNVVRERVITRRKHAVPSDQEIFPAIKDDFVSDRKSATTGSNIFVKSLKSSSTGKED